jgi:hypothetical protein
VDWMGPAGAVSELSYSCFRLQESEDCFEKCIDVSGVRDTGHHRYIRSRIIAAGVEVSQATSRSLPPYQYKARPTQNPTT